LAALATKDFRGSRLQEWQVSNDKEVMQLFSCQRMDDAGKKIKIASAPECQTRAIIVPNSIGTHRFSLPTVFKDQEN
jgi:hypothetical protein